MELDADLAADMAARGTRLISTLCVFRSWRTFGVTTTIERFVDPERQRAAAAREERAIESVRLAHAAGVAIATGTDFGGGSTRANQLAWEVECLVDAGLEPWQALGAATWRGGELLGEPDAGVLREGGPADLVARPRRPALRPDRPLAGVARLVGFRQRSRRDLGIWKKPGRWPGFSFVAMVGSAATRGAPAVEALVAAAVADHDRAAVGAAGGVGLGLEAHLGGAQGQGDRRAAAPVPIGLASPIRCRSRHDRWHGRWSR